MSDSGGTENITEAIDRIGGARIRRPDSAEAAVLQAHLAVYGMPSPKTDGDNHQMRQDQTGEQMNTIKEEQAPVVPQDWSVKWADDLNTWRLDLFENRVAYFDADGWLQALDGDLLIAPWPALVALEYAYRNNIQPPHADNQHPVNDDMQVKPETSVDHVVLQGTRRWFKVQVGDQVRYTRSQNQPFYRRDGRLDTGNTSPFKDALYRHFEPQCIEGRRVQFEQVDAALLRRVKGGPVPDVPDDE